MRTRALTTTGGALLALALAAGGAQAADYALAARSLTVTMPDGTPVPMWGFALGTGAPTVPGPALTVPPGDDTLNIELTNELAVPVSLVIPGQPGALNPTFVAGLGGAVTAIGGRPAGDYTSRLRSFATETPPGQTRTYTWTGLKPGTYLYHSGTHVQVQVQMGLYGAARVVPAAGEAYAGVGHDNEALLVFSEIDPALHAAVDDGSYGTVAYPSTVDYAPKYFLINGQPHPASDPRLDHAPRVGERVLLRLVNAGLESRMAALAGGRMTLLGEDGNLYPFAKDEASAELPAGKTVDALFTPTGGGRYAIFDRTLALSNAGAGSAGGMLVHLEVAGGNGAPTAGDDAYGVGEDGALAIAAGGVLGNDSDPENDLLTAALVAGPVHGQLAFGADGGSTYTPDVDFSGGDAFTYRANDGASNSNVATVVITVTPANDAPTALPESYDADEGTPLSVPAPGVLANDGDVDGDALQALLIAAPAHGGVALGPDGDFLYTPDSGYVGPDSFTYVAFDGMDTSPEITVSLTVSPVANQAPVAVDDFGQTRRRLRIILTVLANDYDVDGTLAPASLRFRVRPVNGAVGRRADGTVVYRANRGFLGTDTFTYVVRDNEGALSNEATVRVNVTR